jgi:hypothetical protein
VSSQHIFPVEVTVSGLTLILPYAVEDTNRKARFSANMEIAAILCAAEADRKKKTGLLRGTAETLTHISKLHYPFWAIPCKENCLLVDGMGINADSILYDKPPDVETFTEHLKRSTAVEELYHSALRSHSETFSEFISHTEIPVKGLITDKGFLSDMTEFIKEPGADDAQPAEATQLLQPQIDKDQVAKIGQQILDHYWKLQSEMKGLRFAIDALTQETKIHVDKLRQELDQIREKHETKISTTATEVEKKKGELREQRDSKLEEIAALHEKEVNARLQEKKRWEQELSGLEQNRSEYEKRKEMRKRKNDEIGVARWDARLKDVQNQISTVKGKVKTISQFITRSNKETEKTTKTLHDHCQKSMDAEERRITDLENLRDAEVKKKEKEIEDLQNETLAIADKIERLIEQKEDRASRLEEAVMHWKADTIALICVPFYLIQYEADGKGRALIRPPVTVRHHDGLVMKIRKKLSYNLESKISTLMKSRSKAVEKTLASLEKMLNQKKRARKIVSQLGKSLDLLTSTDFKERVVKGLDELEAEGWISPDEKANILDAYVKGHPASANQKA